MAGTGARDGSGTGGDRIAGPGSMSVAREGDALTLLFGAKDTEHNQAVVLAGVLKEQRDCEVDAD